MADSDAPLVTLEVQRRHGTLLGVLEQRDGLGLRVILGVGSFLVVKVGFEEVEDGVVAHDVLAAHGFNKVSHCVTTVVFIGFLTLVLTSFHEVLETLFVVLAVPSFFVVHFLVFYVHLLGVDCRAGVDVDVGDGDVVAQSLCEFLFVICWLNISFLLYSLIVTDRKSVV